MPKTTYILGAGASCYALPLTVNIKPRMQILMDLLKGDLNNTYGFKLNLKTKKIHARYKLIFDQLIKHQTPDTYAKKLWLNDELDKLELLKEFLTLYFQFEQDFKNSLFDPGKLKEKNNSVSGAKDDDKIIEKIIQAVDYRYDVFLATYLERINDTLQIPEQVNIISWNYDNQIELSYFLFSNKVSNDETLKNLKIFPNKISQEFSASNLPKIIKLNGQCDIRTAKEDDSLRSSEDLDFFKSIEKINAGKDFDNSINFAWECSDPQNQAVEFAKYTLIQSNKLVIIGYSFPNFNRAIDKEILRVFHDENLNDSPTEIYIQVPDPDEFKAIKERLLSCLSKNLGSRLDQAGRIKHISDKDQFYVPF